ncbi:LacI family DNA-binding transcriptional regulator [Tuanshanicoccus lijuaniae]|uniref:LacI family DNA-binding transcriptional regulator n=1 Tax=Aerococcaceae bacterium zg-1292 TaxID=2774330 RepID=UPI001BD84D7B|nr:LacI family DNA-binding transcriptional regulator [Aerococcaceae bacterium zg-BR9]MBS4456735.1 LacI family DNA-binding transcriptional regulator [Aerococcaceae bacterium zg-A91]MBS4458527.1 LacI family DNA-binding transcriptional regulator [Aerococcaceae bacterium zg-BR33]
MRVKIQDVAREAGVSPGTVSRVFNNYYDISDETKRRVLKVAKRLNYVPNVAARTLSSKNTRKVAMIFSEFQLNQKNAIPLEMLSGVHDSANVLGIEFILLLISKKEQKEKSFQTLCMENNITGAVIQGLDMDDPYYKEIQETSIPTVLIDLYFDSPNSYSVSIDNVTAAFEVVSKLIELGHKNIAMISGKVSAMVSNEREKGYKKALETYGIPIDESKILYADFDEKTSFEKTEELMKEHPSLTAIFCASDLMAIGAIHKLQDMGYIIPDDISIFGFDDLFVANYVNPSLSSVNQDMYKIGKEACKVAVKLMNNEYLADKKIYIPHKLVLRNSITERVVE